MQQYTFLQEIAVQQTMKKVIPLKKGLITAKKKQIRTVNPKTGAVSVQQKTVIRTPTPKERMVAVKKSFETIQNAKRKVQNNLRKTIVKKNQAEQAAKEQQIARRLANKQKEKEISDSINGMLADAFGK